MGGSCFSGKESSTGNLAKGLPYMTPQSRVFLAREAADFRRVIDGLAALCRQRLG